MTTDNDGGSADSSSGRGTVRHPSVAEHLVQSGWTTSRQRRMVDGLRALQAIASKGTESVTYAQFADQVQPGMSPRASGAILRDIGLFCNEAEWPNVTCFVVSATTGECSDGFSAISSDDPVTARDKAWFSYAVYKSGPLVDQQSA